jgi:hypothetical protein
MVRVVSPAASARFSWVRPIIFRMNLTCCAMKTASQHSHSPLALLQLLLPNSEPNVPGRLPKVVSNPTAKIRVFRHACLPRNSIYLRPIATNRGQGTLNCGCGQGVGAPAWAPRCEVASAGPAPRDQNVAGEVGGDPGKGAAGHAAGRISGITCQRCRQRSYSGRW